MSEQVFINAFKKPLDRDIVVSSDNFGTLKFSYVIEKLGTVSTLRYKVDDQEDIYEVPYDLMKTHGLQDLNKYFRTVSDNLAYQVMEYKKHKYEEFNLHEDDLKFLNYFVNKMDNFHIGKSNG